MKRCAALYNADATLHACRRPAGHYGRHKARFTIYPETYHGRPLWQSRVTLRWSNWRSIPTDVPSSFERTQ